MNAETKSTSKPPLALWRADFPNTNTFIVVRAGEIRGVMIDAVSAISKDGSEHLYTMTRSMTNGYEPKVGDFLMQFMDGKAIVEPRQEFLDLFNRIADDDDDGVVDPEVLARWQKLWAAGGMSAPIQPPLPSADFWEVTIGLLDKGYEFDRAECAAIRSAWLAMAPAAAREAYEAHKGTSTDRKAIAHAALLDLSDEEIREFGEMWQNAKQSVVPIQADHKTLWCVHVRSTNRLNAAQSYDAAVVECDHLNEAIRAAGASISNGAAIIIPHLTAVPAIWPGTAEDHAKALIVGHA